MGERSGRTGQRARDGKQRVGMRAGEVKGGTKSEGRVEYG
jgi:hypothetical protein